MSVSASIDVILSKGDKKQRAIEIIQVLINSGWTLFQNGYIGYLPFGDKDGFDWQEKQGLTFEALTQILDAKEQADEVIGLIMTWKNTGIGGAFLFWPEGNLHTLSLNIDASRQIIVLEDDYAITDFQWYLPKLLTPLNKVWMVEYFSFEQHI